MLKAAFVMIFALLSFNSAYAERISIGELFFTAKNNGTVTYIATIIDHNLDLANLCRVIVEHRKPAPVRVNCLKQPYHSQLPAGANVTSVFITTGPLPAAPGAVWEADQSSGAIQFCIFSPSEHEEPCTLIQFVH
jgi:hypothetical protein